MTNTLKAPDWMDRCDDCGWPLLEDRSAGCHEFDCSFRPQHGSEEYKRWKAGQSLTFEERKQSRNYIRRLETRISNLESSDQTRQQDSKTTIERITDSQREETEERRNELDRVSDDSRLCAKCGRPTGGVLCICTLDSALRRQ